MCLSFYRATLDLLQLCHNKVDNTIDGSKITEDIKLLQMPLNYFFEYNSLFFPASRTGLLLLYREFFANKTDDMILYSSENGKIVENEDRYGGLTKPMYEFSRFLQTYLEDDNEKNKDLSYSEIITRINSNLDYTFYENSKPADLSKGMYTLVNKYFDKVLQEV